MPGTNLTSLILVALVFLTVLFWVQTFFAYWQAFIVPKTDKEPHIILSFTILLTIVTIIFYWLTSRQKNKLDSRMVIDPPDEVTSLDDETFGTLL